MGRGVRGGCPACQRRKGTFVNICCCQKWFLSSSSHPIVCCPSGGEYKTTPSFSRGGARERDRKRHTFWVSLCRIRVEGCAPASPGEASLRLSPSGKMSGSGLCWNCWSMSGLECFPLRGSVCDLGMDFSVGADLFGFCFLGYIFFVLSDMPRKFQIFS